MRQTEDGEYRRLSQRGEARAGGWVALGVGQYNDQWQGFDPGLLGSALSVNHRLVIAFGQFGVLSVNLALTLPGLLPSLCEPGPLASRDRRGTPPARNRITIRIRIQGCSDRPLVCK